MSEGNDVQAQGLLYLRALRCFDRVVSSCFGMTLDPGYIEAITDFKDAYGDLNISITPKVNM